MLRRSGRTTAILLTGFLTLTLCSRIAAAGDRLTTEEILSGSKSTNTTDRSDPGLVTGETQLTKKVLDGSGSRLDSIAATQKPPKEPKGSGTQDKPPKSGDISEPGTAGLLIAGTFVLLLHRRRKVL